MTTKFGLLKLQLTTYGTLRTGGQSYALLRQMPFADECYKEYPGQKFYVAYWDGDTVLNPHILVVQAPYTIDIHKAVREVIIYSGFESEMEAIPDEVTLEMRPIEMILQDA